MPFVEGWVVPCNSFSLPLLGKETADARTGVYAVLEFSPGTDK